MRCATDPARPSILPKFRRPIKGHGAADSATVALALIVATQSVSDAGAACNGPNGSCREGWHGLLLRAMPSSWPRQCASAEEVFCLPYNHAAGAKRSQLSLGGRAAADDSFVSEIIVRLSDLMVSTMVVSELGRWLTSANRGCPGVVHSPVAECGAS
jgi:hypothetical protein